MENQEFDIELLEKKLEEYEQADSNVRSEEVLEFVKKVLDITLLQLSKGNVSDRDIEEDRETGLFETVGSACTTGC